jgi:16S rRNA (guanine527-N7)-methyltransferase
MSREAVAAWPLVDETALARLDRYVALLGKWQGSINLVAPSTIPTAWARHVLDSVQLTAHLPDRSSVLVDLGSGAGFPGLVLAIVRRELDVHLVESDRRKAEFLRHVSRETSTPVTVWARRIEEVATSGLKADVVTARALAPLAQLIDISEPFCHEQTVRLFPKGQSADAELTRLGSSKTLRVATLPSITAASAAIIRVEGKRLG